MAEIKSTRKCSVDGCERKYLAKSFCNMHYKRWTASGDPGAAETIVVRNVCSVDGCARYCSGKGLCKLHYQRDYRGNPDDSLQPLRVRAKSCNIIGCGRAHKSLGYCGLHYQRAAIDGSPGGVGLIREPGRKCDIDQCGRIHHARGRCRLHIYDLRNPGRKQSTECGRCGDFIDLSLQVETGRRQHSDTRLCKVCRRAMSSRAKYSWRAVIKEAGNQKCQLCHKNVDISLRFPDPMSPSVDHIVPWSHGGPSELWNLQLAHLRCNMSKNATLPDGMLSFPAS